VRASTSPEIPGTVGPENAHNYFIQVLAEVGTIGLFALGFFLVTIALAVWPSPDQAPPRIRMAMGLSAGLLGFVLTWVTGHPLLTLSNQLWLATVLAVGVAAVGVSTMSERPKPAPQTGRTWLHARAWLLHRFWVPGTIMLTLAVAAPRVVVAARSGSPASYAAGVYAWESGPATEGAPADTRFRWTRGRAAVREPVRGTVLAVPFYLARPLPATLYARIGGVTLDPVTFSRTGWHSLSYDLGALLGEEQWRSERVITVEFRVSPTFVPAQAGESDDVRELGVGLGVPSWSGRNSLAPTPP
jgi:hypothetical protein